MVSVLNALQKLLPGKLQPVVFQQVEPDNPACDQFVIGQRVRDRRFGLGTIVGEFQYLGVGNSISLYHILLDVRPPMPYAMGRNPVYVFSYQMDADVD